MPRTKRDKLLSIERVAELTALAVRTIQAGKCGTDELLRVELGAKTVFVEADVLAWIEKRIAGAREKRRQTQQPGLPANVVRMRPVLVVANETIHNVANQFRKAK